MRNCNSGANTILRVNHETGKSYNTVPQVIQAGGKLPTGWKDEKGRKAKKGTRDSEIGKVEVKKREIKPWTDAEVENVLKMRAEGELWRVIGAMYGVHQCTVMVRVKRYQEKQSA